MSILRSAYLACEDCGGGFPGEVDEDLVCICGGVWATGERPPLVVGWENIRALIGIRTGGHCEIRTPACLVARRDFDLRYLPDYQRSLHHRRPRGMGGTRRADVHSPAALLSICGSGTSGCHGYVEKNREWSYDRGYLVPNVGVGDAVDCAAVPMTLWSGRRVLLSADSPWYLPAPGLPYAV